MTRYCTNCGGIVPPVATFCTSCGTQQAVPSPAPASGAAAPVSKGGGLGKALLIVGGLFLAVVAVGIGGIVYMVYRAKDAVQEVAKREGIELGDLAASVGQRGSLRGADPCSFLSASDAGEVLGLAVTKAEVSGDTCNYYVSKSGESKAQSFEEAVQKLKESKAGEGGLTDVERIAKELAGAGNDGSAPYLTIQYHEDGKAAMTGFKIAMRAMGAIDRVSGIGEEALAGPMGSMFIFLKNGVAVQFDLRQVARGRDRGTEMARRIAARL